MSYFHGKYIPLSSALRRFTVLFGMGRGGTTSLWSSGKEVDTLAPDRRTGANASHLEEASVGCDAVEPSAFEQGCTVIGSSRTSN